MRIFIAALCTLLAMFASTTACADTVARSGTISYVVVDNRPCVFFALDGVSEASPAFPGQIWIALPKTTENFSEIYAALLAAKFSRATIQVQVNGAVSCGGYASTNGLVVQ